MYIRKHRRSVKNLGNPVFINNTASSPYLIEQACCVFEASMLKPRYVQVEGITKDQNDKPVQMNVNEQIIALTVSDY